MYIVGGLVLISIIYVFFIRKKKTPAVPFEEIPKRITEEIKQKVAFYYTLNQEEQESFISRVYGFMQQNHFLGLHTKVTETDKLLVASSAIIPVFRFPDWEYINLNNIYITPGFIPEEFHPFTSKVAGMVKHKTFGFDLYLSRKSLTLGFRNIQDKKHVGYHEFAHLIDGLDGDVDGLPKLLLDEEHQKQWNILTEKYIDEIKQGDAKIDAYGATNKSEFFAVITEYFYENPFLLKKKYPELYEFLVEIYDSDLVLSYKRNMQKSINKPPINRNNDCPCKSGKKYKDCCQKFNS